MVILRRVIDEVKGDVEHVEIVAAASREPREAAEPYLRAFEEMGIRRVDALPLQGRSEVEESRTVERLGSADVIYLTGGDQRRLADVFRGTRALDVIRERYAGGAVIAGTSAGAAAMSSTMIARGAEEEGLNKGNVETEEGLGLLPSSVIDTHFIQRGRFGRLMEAVTHERTLIGLGISEDTALVVREGRRLEVVGSDNVIVVDGHEIGHSSHDEADHGEAMAVERIVVHALSEGYSYDLETRAFHAPKGAAKKVSA